MFVYWMRAVMTPTSVPHGPAVSWPCTCMRTGMAAHWPMVVGPARATGIVGPSGGQLGLRRYCQFHRSRLPSVASAPNTRRYIAVIWHSSSGRQVSMVARARTAVLPRRPASTLQLGCEARSILTSWPMDVPGASRGRGLTFDSARMADWRETRRRDERAAPGGRSEQGRVSRHRRSQNSETSSLTGVRKRSTHSVRQVSG